MTFVPGTALEFFAGIGLARMGLEAAGWKVVFANDIDPKKLEMHKGHWGDDPAYRLADVFDIHHEEVPSAELAWASFPCIDLSLAGNRAGLSGASSGAYWGFHRLLAQLGDRRPPIVIIENVHGMLTSRGGADLRLILSGLNELGFTVDLLAIDAAHFVPQSRPRLFIVGLADPYLLSGDPVGESPIRPQSVLRFRQANPEIRWGLLPTRSLPRARPPLDSFLEHFPPDADIWWSPVDTAKLVSQMSAKHLAAVEALRPLSKLSHATVYRRVRSTGCMAEVRLDGLAGCLRTPRGGSSRQFVLEVGRGDIRARHMTAIEYGRLQGADHFRIEVPFNQALFGFGDAVCVPAVEWLASEIRLAVGQYSGGLAVA